MDFIDSVVNQISGVLWSYIVITVLIVLGIVFTIRTSFVQIRFLREMFRLIKTGVGAKTTGREISSFQALCISTASRVGVGNIAGIAIAIVTGGPGAIFWMWIIAILGSATGFVESTLAQIYKVPLAGDGYHGGPAYYIRNALKQPKVANLFAVLITITFALVYNSVQSNTIAIALENTFEISPVVTGIVCALLTGLIIFGGGYRIARVTEVLVPFMAGAYILVALGIMFYNITAVPSMFALILHDAFCPQAAVGGGFAAVIMTGIKRGLFSNEAGEGSVPNAAACATTSHPVKQGLIQAFGVYVDTLFVCTSTATVILLSGVYEIGSDVSGIVLATNAFTSHLGTWAAYAMSIMITIFAFSSVIGNYYYGEVNVGFLSQRKRAMFYFRLFVMGMVFFGSVATMQLVWDLADLFMAFLALTNLYAIARLYKYAHIALVDYIKQKKNKVLEPVFHSSILPNQDGVQAWDNEDGYLKKDI